MWFYGSHSNSHTGRHPAWSRGVHPENASVTDSFVNSWESGLLLDTHWQTYYIYGNNQAPPTAGSLHKYTHSMAASMLDVHSGHNWVLRIPMGSSSQVTNVGLPHYLGPWVSLCTFFSLDLDISLSWMLVSCMACGLSPPEWEAMPLRPRSFPVSSLSCWHYSCLHWKLKILVRVVGLLGEEQTPVCFSQCIFLRGHTPIFTAG